MKFFNPLLISLLISLFPNVLFNSAGLFAKDNNTPVLTLSDCIQYALNYNPNIKYYEAYEAASKARVKGQISGILPSLYSNIGLRRSGSSTYRNSQTDDYQQTSYSGGINIRQNIFDFSSLKSITSARENFNAQKFNTRARRQDIIRAVTSSYYSAVASQRDIHIAKENLALARVFLELTRTLRKDGKSSEYDVTVARIDSINAEITLEESTIRHEKNIARLIEQIGYPGISVSSLEDNLFFSAYPINLDDAIDQALENRPDYKASSSSIASREANLSATYGRLLPTINFNGGYDWNGYEDNYDYSSQGWNIGLGISIPIFSGFGKKADIDIAKSYLSGVKFNKEELRQRIIYEVQVSYYSLIQSEKQVKLSEVLVETTTRNYELALFRYQSGKGIPLEVSSAKSSLIRARQSNLNFLLGNKLAITELRRAMGIIE